MKSFILIILLMVFIAVIFYRKGYQKGYNIQQLKIDDLNAKLDKIKHEFENYIKNRNKEVKKIKEELKTLRRKQTKINVFIKELRKARNEKNNDLLKQYIDRLLREFK